MDQSKAFNVPSPDCLGQCNKCLATVSVDLVDVLTGVNLIHKDPENPRYKDMACGGTIRLFQEFKRG